MTPDRLRAGRSLRHVGLIALLVAAAAPVQSSQSLPLLGRASALDLVLLGALWSLFAGVAFTGRGEIVYPPLFVLVAIPAFVTSLSMLWSDDLGSTMQQAFASVLGLVAYAYVLRETDGMSPERIYRYMRWFVYFLIVPPILMLLDVPGFAPQEPGLSETSAEYVGYFSRFSHPFIGRSNNLASVLAFFVPILAYRALIARTRADRVAAVIVVAAIVVTQSRGVLIALLLTAPLLFLSSAELRRHSRRVVWATGITLLVAAASLGVLIRLNPATTEFFSNRFSSSGLDERQTLLEEGFERVEARPLAGYGGGISPLGEIETGGEDAHNTYLQQAISFGVPLGAVVSASLIAIVPFLFTRRSSTGLVVGYAVLGQLLIFATEASFEGTVLRMLFYLSLGLGVALVRSGEEGREIEQPGPDTLERSPVHGVQTSPAVVDLTAIRVPPSAPANGA